MAQGRNKAMAVRKNFVSAMTAVALLAGCATAAKAPATQAADVEFLRGCWVAKTAPGGAVMGFLRLLPEGAAGPAYRGAVGGMGDGKVGAQFSFARDGSAATVVAAAGSAPNAYRKASYELLAPEGSMTTYAAYAREGAADERLIAEVAGERLKIHTLAADGQDKVLFEGERDGCD